VLPNRCSRRCGKASIAKIKEDLAWRSVTGVPMKNIVLTRGQAEELVAGFERLSSQGGKE
jgi:hypothetical protein